MSTTICAFVIFLSTIIIVAHGQALNPIDKCWRMNTQWRRNRQQLAMCSAGFAGKMTNNIGRDVTRYVVTDPSDDPVKPKPGTLRYGTTMIKGKKWVTFKRSMRIKLDKPLLISSFTTIDGRGTNVHIANGACLIVYKANNVIIHGLRIHHCKAQPPSSIMGPDAKIISLGQVDADAIRLVTATKIWIDHNTLYKCNDGLLDVTRGSTDVTISNNWFRNQDKVMLLGHDDGYIRDQNMKVTVAFNHFGPNCNQRMPRLRHGYAHVANNLYQGWTQYAIGGSQSPRIKSESNFFIAPNSENKEVTWKQNKNGQKFFYSVGDLFKNGASFSQTVTGRARPNYSPEQAFQVQPASKVRSLTSSAGALQCSKRSRC
ncbi:hypothetical protein ACFE04_004963 [Oxalis oulophora]